MVDNELKHLESQIEHIIKLQQQLITENRSLKKRLEQILRERANHLNQDKKARDLLKQMIIQLKDKLA